MAAEYFANYLVQRGQTQYTCRGDRLYSRLQPGDLIALQRGDTLYRATPNQIQDSDWLAAYYDGQAVRVEGSKVIPLLLAPPRLEPVVATVNGTVFNLDDPPFDAPDGTEVQLEVTTNSESNNLTKSYNWIQRNGDGVFTSSPQARVCTYQLGPSFANVQCQIAAVGSAEGNVASVIVSLFGT